MAVVTIYVHNNEEISNTIMTVEDDTFSAEYEEYDSEGYSIATPDDVDLIFEAEPANGCVFTQWVYRVGSITAKQQYSTDNPFVCSSAQDIYIRAEGEVDEESGSGGGGSGSGATTGGGLYIYTSVGTPSNNPYSRWVKVTPYIYTSIGGWKHWERAQTNLFTSIGGWKHWVSDS